jgi:5-methylcytosine-specific restriction endonuclease McrBC regulatory subunit McrC
MKTNNIIKISEWGKSDAADHEILEKRAQDIQSFFNENKNSKKVIGDFKKRNIFLDYEDYIHNKSNSVGILNLDNNLTLRFESKMDDDEGENFWKFLPQMLDKLENFEGFENRIFVDSKKDVILPKGFSMVSLFALSFVSFCSRAIEIGMYKKYIKKLENTKSIKGKINFQELFNKKPWDLTEIPCEFYDLTFDNNENQIILYCAKKLLSNTKKTKNSYFIKKLRELYQIMSSEISYMDKNINDFNKVNLSALPSYYQNLMLVCKSILSKKLFSFDSEEEFPGVNFLIDMEWVFEQYMTKMFEEVIKKVNLEQKVNFEVESQSKRNLCDNNRIRLKPDLLLKREGETEYIIDFKWKFRDGKSSNSDYYQAICYGLAELEKLNGDIKEIKVALFAVDDGEEIKEKEKDIISNVFEMEDSSDKKKKIIINDIRLGKNLLIGKVDEIEEKIKKEIMEKIVNKLIK